jgi:hypothetical protein
MDHRFFPARLSHESILKFWSSFVQTAVTFYSA